MFQSLDNLVAEHPVLNEYLKINSIVQYIDVSSLNSILEKIDSKLILVKPKKTFYGTIEAVVKDPSGFIVIFAEQQK